MKIIVYLLFTFMTFNSVAQIDKIEPPFWWSGMQMKDLQILMHGENISNYLVTAEAPVIITSVKRTENPNYLFVSINSEALEPGTYSFNFKAEGKESFSRNYEIKEREAESENRKGFDAADVIYLLMPDRFANGNPENDSHPAMTEKANRKEIGGRHGGDIQGIINHLDYLEDLGVTAIWSTPLLADNDAVFSYHTYAQSDVYHIDPRFGTNKDYRKLADELHRRDMKLIMDYVTNHWGAEHWIIKDLPSYDWIHQFPGYKNSNYRMTTQYDPHRSKIDFRNCVDGWFTSNMPDLNQKNPLLQKYLIQNAIWWIEYAGLDGFRVDTYSYNDKDGIAKWTKAIMEEYPNFNIVGEVWMHDQAQISYWQKDSEIGAIQSYNSYLPSVMDFTLYDAIATMFGEEEVSWDGGMVRAYNNFVNDFLYPNTDNLLVFAENHDTSRFNEIYDGNISDYKLAMSLILTTRGIPQLYYGSEIGMRGDKGKGDADVRRDFPGGWPEDKDSAFTRDGRNSTQEKYHSFTKKLLNYRKKNEVLHFGKLLQFLPVNNVYVYFRYNDEKRLMIVLNNSKEKQELNLSRYAEGLKSHTSGENILTGEMLSLKNELVIEGKTPMVIELK